jgi:hypothetical protein
MDKREDVPTVTVLEKPEGQAWCREESCLIADNLGCHVERWTKFPRRMVAHILGVPRWKLVAVLKQDNFVVGEVPHRDMWEKELT